MSAPVEFITTKKASELLKISASTLRVYAQSMEALGYEFKKIDNARQFSHYDLQLINESMTRYKKRGGTMKDALHYVIVKENEGPEAAESLETSEVVQHSHSSTRFDLNELQNDITQKINSNLNNILDHRFNELIEAIRKPEIDKNDINLLKDDIAQLRASSEEIRNDRDKYIRLYEQLERENEGLQQEIESLKKMSIWEFRKWKKNN
ncbi:hypothetical protein [Staphylococcus epidermidis]|uniref:hypothetical protein n=1 Tax=Staphylococcus epidermidis TaxID=1282 RepID=UPI0020946FF3|nr:hypothetical protein [Staphylococcus epidermidis]MCO6321389.1 hypothetical protein [Staphylococcus epidermidis]